MSQNAMKRTLSVAALMFASMFSGQANAQSWAGMHVGLGLGYSDGTADASTTTVFSATGYFATTSVPAIGAIGHQQMKPRSVIGDADIGYDFQSGNLVFGISADASMLPSSHAHQSGTGVYPCCGPTNFTVTQQVKTDMMTTVQGRAGLNLGNGSGHDALFYVTGGFAAEHVKYNALFTDTFATAHESASKSDWATGWIAGVGADFQMGNHWSMRPEIEHADFGSVSMTSTNLTATVAPGTFPTNVFTHKVDLTNDIARVSFDYHF